MPKGTINPDLIDRFLLLKGQTGTQLGLFMVFVYCLSVFAMLHKYIYTNIVKIFSFIAQLSHIPKWLSKLFLLFSQQPFIVPLIFSSLILIMGIGIFSYNFNVLASMTSALRKSTMIDEEYIENKIDDFKQIDINGNYLNDNQKPNLILVISESLENTFADTSLFEKDLISDLTNIKDKSDSINDLIMVNGCQYTIASMYSLLYGIPLLYLQCKRGDPIQENIFHKRCFSIFDVLHSSGYKITHLQGTNLKFAGQGKLFEYIPEAKVIGSEKISLE